MKKQPNQKATKAYYNLLIESESLVKYKASRNPNASAEELCNWAWENRPIEGEKESYQLIKMLKELSLSHIEQNSKAKKLGLESAFIEGVYQIVDNHINNRLAIYASIKKPEIVNNL